MRNMRKEIRRVNKLMEILLITLSISNLILNLIIIANRIYDTPVASVIIPDSNLVATLHYKVYYWFSNMLTYIVAIFYAINIYQHKKSVLLRLYFCLFTVCTTPIIVQPIISLIAKLLHIG